MALRRSNRDRQRSANPTTAASERYSDMEDCDVRCHGICRRRVCLCSRSFRLDRKVIQIIDRVCDGAGTCTGITLRRQNLRAALGGEGLHQRQSEYTERRRRCGSRYPRPRAQGGRQPPRGSEEDEWCVDHQRVDSRAQPEPDTTGTRTIRLRLIATPRSHPSTRPSQPPHPPPSRRAHRSPRAP